MCQETHTAHKGFAWVVPASGLGKACRLPFRLQVTLPRSASASSPVKPYNRATVGPTFQSVVRPGRGMPPGAQPPVH